MFEIFSIVKGIQQDIVTNLHRPYSIVPVIAVRFH